MELLVLYIVFVLLCGVYATTKKRNFLGYALLAFIISPILTFFVILIIGEYKEPQAKQCNKEHLRLRTAFIECYVEGEDKYSKHPSLRLMYNDLTACRFVNSNDIKSAMLLF